MESSDFATRCFASTRRRHGSPLPSGVSPAAPRHRARGGRRRGRSPRRALGGEDSMTSWDSCHGRLSARCFQILNISVSTPQRRWLEGLYGWGGRALEAGPGRGTAEICWESLLAAPPPVKALRIRQERRPGEILPKIPWRKYSQPMRGGTNQSSATAGGVGGRERGGWGGGATVTRRGAGGRQQERRVECRTVPQVGFAANEYSLMTRRSLRAPKVKS